MMRWFIFLLAVWALPVDKLTADEEDVLQADPPITHKVTFNIEFHYTDIESNLFLKEPAGSLTLGLFGITAPKTVKNFVELSNMTYGYGYEGSPFHRIITNFMIQGGDFTNGDGTGGKSIYGGKFDDETFELRHNKRGRLSMANSGSNTNGGQFFITDVDDCGWLDGKHVVFGQLMLGFETLDLLSELKTDVYDKPDKNPVIQSAEVMTIYDTSAGVVHENTVKVELVEEEGTTGFVYFFIVLLLAAVWLLKRVYFRRQYITDIKDSNFF